MLQNKPVTLWNAVIPGPQSPVGVEVDITKPTDGLVMGKRVARISQVSVPTVTVYTPSKTKRTGTAVVVCPGGGFSILALDLEGSEVATWLNGIGVTAIVLKYRVPTSNLNPNWLGPAMDTQRALSLARTNAKEWGIDPQRIGVLGFSAGGKTAAMAALSCGNRLYPPQDRVDTAPCNADFAILIYPAYLVDGNQHLQPEVKVSKDAPPTFFAHASDDPVSSQNTFVLAAALQTARVPVGVHVYPEGGHGYGLRPDPTKPVTSWPDRCTEWLLSRKLLASR